MHKIDYILNLNKKQLKIFEERCRPDHGHKKNSQFNTYGNDLYSDSGFINDTESLYEICKTDDEYVTNILGKNGHDIISGALASLLYKKTFKKKHPELCYDINTSNYEYTCEQYMGVQYCPFVDITTKKCGHEIFPQFGGINFNITNKKTNEILKITALHHHLIYHHHFYEGVVPYRVSPQELINFFELENKY